MSLLLSRQPTLRELHPALFALEHWRDLLRPRRRRCRECNGYLWLDLDGAGRERLVCSICGTEAH